MSPLWWLEGFNLMLSILGAVTCGVAAALFFVVFQFEKKTTTLWRPFGFVLLAITFAMHALSAITATTAAYQAAVTLEVFAFFLIYRGVHSEPIVSHLREVSSLAERTTAPPVSFKSRFPRGSRLLLVVVAVALAYFFDGPYMLSALSLITAAYMAATMRLQWKRYRWEQDSPAIKRQNLLALLAYIFLLGRALALSIFYAATQLPMLAIIAYVGMLVATALGLYFLARWAWIFIRVRAVLRHSFVSLLVLTVSWIVGILLVIPLILGGLIYLLTAWA